MSQFRRNIRASWNWNWGGGEGGKAKDGIERGTVYSKVQYVRDEAFGSILLLTNK